MNREEETHYAHALEALQHWQDVASMYKVEIDKQAERELDLIARIDTLKDEIDVLMEKADAD